MRRLLSHRPGAPAALSTIHNALKGHSTARLPRKVWAAATALLPEQARRDMKAAGHAARRFSPFLLVSTKRVVPLSREFGFDRGLPVDRYYIERFLREKAPLVAGTVLEVGDSSYTRQFGGARVERADVLNVDSTIPGTTITADLASAETIASASFDCLIITQTLHLVYDLEKAAATLHRILKPGGTLLLTVPGISPISTDRWADTWYWSLTPLCAQRLFGGIFGPQNIEVKSHGNALSSVAFLRGLAAEELREHVLKVDDPQFPMLVTVAATRPRADAVSTQLP